MTKFREDFTEPINSEEVVEIDFQDLFVGNIYDGHNKDIWGFTHSDPSQTKRPGACVRFDNTKNEATLLKGTSRVPNPKLEAYFVEVDHMDKSILSKITFFRISPPHSLRLHKMRKLHDYGYRGPLSGNDLERLQSAMVRIFSYQGESVK